MGRFLFFDGPPGQKLKIGLRHCTRLGNTQILSLIEENRLRNKKVYAFTNLVVSSIYKHISPGVIKWILLYNYCLATSELPRLFAIS